MLKLKGSGIINFFFNILFSDFELEKLFKTGKSSFFSAFDFIFCLKKFIISNNFCFL